MKFRCNDLHEHGVVLIPHDSAAFAPLLADIKRHIEDPPPGSPPRLPNDRNTIDADDPSGAILWNQSEKPICAYTLTWIFDWRDEFGKERKTKTTLVLGIGHSPSLLLPFGLAEERRRTELYWNTILPGSKRYVSDDEVLGSNDDVRPPAGNEQRQGGAFMRWGGGGWRASNDLNEITLALDAVFFADGECVGPDTHGLWEHIVPAADLHLGIAVLARRGIEARIEAAHVFASVRRLQARRMVLHRHLTLAVKSVTERIGNSPKGSRTCGLTSATSRQPPS